MPLVFRATDAAFQLRDELQTLRFATAQRRTRLAQLQITESSIDEQRKRPRDLRMGREKLRRFFDRHFHHVADRFVVVENFERLRIVTASAAVLARHERFRQKIHFQFDHALALCRSRNDRLRR